jgi:hypothetical protein
VNAIHNRLQIANLYGGEILMTTLILVFGRATPKVVRAFAIVLRYLAA